MMPIIALTANAMVTDKERCFNEGMDDYLVKPVELSQLAEILSRWITQAGSFPANTTVAKVIGDPEEDFDGDSLLRLLMGDRELARDILIGFIHDAPCQLKNLQLRIDESDIPGLKLQAHTLKGSAATVGADALRASAKALESEATAGNLDLCRSYLSQANKHFARFRAKLEDEGWASKADSNTGIEEKCDV